MGEHLDWHNEGKAQFQVGSAFYNPQSKLVRDLGILAAIAYKQERGSLRVLDALGGCGVRGLRYWLEAEADYVWVNEGNLELKELLRQNLANVIAQHSAKQPASNCCRVTNLDAHHVFFDCYQRRDYYDFVDVDCFGSAAPYLSTMLWATKIGGLMYLTATDGRTLTGNLPLNSIQSYAAIARSHPAAHEQALRLLIGSVQQQAATIDLGVEPIFSWFTGTNYRLLLRLTAKPQLTDLNYGFLAYCHYCGNYSTSSWRKLGQINCKCDRPNITVSGAMWLGRLHHPHELTKLIEIARKLNWQKASDLLSLMLAELASPPYFYTLREIGKRGQLNIPKRSYLMEALQDAGYQSSYTHINLQAIKTNADLDICIEIARNLSKK